MRESRTGVGRACLRYFVTCCSGVVVLLLPTEDVPEELGNLTSLQKLWLGKNNLSGKARAKPGLHTTTKEGVGRLLDCKNNL